MFKVVTCSCGKSLRAYEGMPEIRCPVCRRSLRLESGPPVVKSPAADPWQKQSSPQPVSFSEPGAGAAKVSSEMVVFGFDQPPPREQKVPLNYKVIEVSSETTTPSPKLRPIEPDRSDHKFQRELWGPDVDLEGDWPDIQRKRRGEWMLERAWYECLVYPLRGLPLIGALGLALTIATVGLLQAVREEIDGGWFFYLIGCAALTYLCGFLTCAITAGAKGYVLLLHWPRANLKLLLESMLAALLSFLAGPIFPAVVGVFFWINAGEMTLIDELVLLELMTVTVGYWLLVFVSVSLSDRWSALLPAAVIKRVRYLGLGRMFIALGIALAIFFVHAWLGLIGIENHQSFATFLLLLICWASLIFWMVFLMRWLGVSAYHLRKARTPTRSASEVR